MKSNSYSVRRQRQCERGSTSIEVALVLLLYFAILFSIVYASFLVFAWNSAAFAAHAATRYAMVHGASSGNACTSNQIQVLVRNTSGLQSAAVTTTWTPNNSAGSTVNVYVSLPVSVFIPLIATKSVTIASSSQMKIIQ